MERVYGYVRLSRDDDKEQNSLNNQKKILLDFAKQKGYNIIDIMEDDNISGMTFNREGLNKLKELAENGKVDIILVKDLSRIGRHKAYSALFLDDLKSLNVKVISITENIDNFNENDDLVIGIKQILNEQYAKDISRKVRSAFKQKQKEGFVIVPPFGYIKEGKEIKINEECADIVRLIFKLYMDGYGCKRIANYLTDHHYYTPSWYQNKLSGKTLPKNKKWTGKNVWSDRTILRILKNDAYKGTLRCGITTRSIIYHYKRYTPEEEHIIHENFYPPIVNEETWDTVQAIINNRSTNNVRAGSGKIHRYAGLLVCEDCGSCFVARRRKNKGNEYIEYICNAYHRLGRNLCTPHKIKEEELDNIIYSYLLKLKDVALDNIKKVDKFIEEWNNRKKDYNKSIEKIIDDIRSLKEEIKQYSKQLAKNFITEEIFQELTKETKENIDLLEQKLNTLNETKEISKNSKSALQNSVDILNQVLENKEITNAELQLLVNKINIKEEDDGLSVNIILNMPFKNHLILSDTITDKTSTSKGYSVDKRY
jgi:DNA invertase Pin-like site-specific DNA recombinase